MLDCYLAMKKRMRRFINLFVKKLISLNLKSRQLIVYLYVRIILRV